MDGNVTALLVGFLGLAGVIVTAWISYQQGMLRVSQDLQIEYDKDLRNRRIEQYDKLWQLLLPLAKYPEPESLSIEEIRFLGYKLRQWYFAGGGLILPTNTRERYFDLQDGIKILLQKYNTTWPETLQPSNQDVIREYLQKRELNEDNREPVYLSELRKHLDRSKEWRCSVYIFEIIAKYKQTNTSSIPEQVAYYLRKLGSELRTSMTSDVMTRQTTILQNESQESRTTSSVDRTSFTVKSR